MYEDSAFLHFTQKISSTYGQLSAFMTTLPSKPAPGIAIFYYICKKFTSTVHFVKPMGCHSVRRAWRKEKQQITNK